MAEQQQTQWPWKFISDLIKEDPKVGFILFLIVVLVAVGKIHFASETEWKKKEEGWVAEKRVCDSSKYALLLWFRDRFEAIDSTQTQIKYKQEVLLNTIGTK